MRRNYFFALIAGLLSVFMIVPCAVAQDTSSTQPQPQPETSITVQNDDEQQADTVTPQNTNPDTNTTDEQPSNTTTPQEEAKKTPTEQQPTPKPQPPATPENTPKQAPRAAADDVQIKDWLNEDTAHVSSLSIESKATGTAPWDKDNNRGNDTDANNNIIRSFDTLTYNYRFVVTPDDSMTYYKNARVGFRVELPLNREQATFDKANMGWADITNGYTATVTQEGNKQVFTAYRRLTATSSAPTVAPGTYTLPIIIKVLGASNNTIIAPKVMSWVAWDSTNPANTGTHTMCEDTPQEVRVSAKLNINIRTSGSGSSSLAQRTFDFNDPQAQGMPNYGLGKVKGVMSTIVYSVEMRWPDRNKGLRGLEMPQGDIRYTFNVKAQWRAANNASTKYPMEADLQPYLWSIGDNNQSTKATMPGRALDDYGYAPSDNNGFPRGRHCLIDKNCHAPEDYGTTKYDRASTYENGLIHFNNQTRNAQGTSVSADVTQWEALTEHFPTLSFGSTSSNPTPINRDLCDANGNIQIATLHVGRLALIYPTVDKNGKNVVDKYKQDVSLLNNITFSPQISATSVTNDHATTQTVTNDDAYNSTILLLRKGNFIQNVLWGCSYSVSVGFDIHNGTDCQGWSGAVSNHGTDQAMRQSKVALYSIAVMTYRTMVAPASVVAFDADYIDIPNNPEIIREGNSHMYDAIGPLSAFALQETTIRYGVKKDGKNWTSFDEQSRVSLTDNKLNFYNTPAEAKQHGKIVAVLYYNPDAAKYRLSDHPGYRFIFDKVVGVVKPTAPLGGVTAITAKTYAWSREGMAGKHGAPSTIEGNDDVWSEWAGKQDLFDLIKKFGVEYSYGTDGRYKKAVYNQDGYQGGDTGGRELGDSLYITGEQPKVGVGTSQKDANNNMKTLYNIDEEERTVDWQIPFHVETQVAPPAGYTTNVYIEVTLPKKMQYMQNSSHLDGTYTPDGSNHVVPVGGTQNAPKVTVNSDGTTTLKWTVQNVSVSKNDRFIRFATTLGDPFNPANDVVNNENFTVKSTIKSTINMAEPNSGYGTLADFTVRVSKMQATQLATRAMTLIADVNQSLQFKDMVNNASSNRRTNVVSVNVLPKHNVAGSIIDGTYTVTSIRVTNRTNIQGFKIVATADPKYATEDIATISKDEVKKWQVLTVASNGTVTIPSNMQHMTAFAVIADIMEPNTHINFDYTIQPHNNKPSNLYVSQLTDFDNTVKAMSAVASRMVSGRVFVDADADGERVPVDTLLAGFRVSLTGKNSTTPITLLDGKQARMVTDKQGEYRFDNVPAGEYRLLFEAPDGENMESYELTVKRAHGVGEDVNSDADPVMVDNKLKHATISLMAFPPVSDMSSSRYTDVNEDVGLIPVVKSSSMPHTGGFPWLYVFMGLGVSVMIGACVLLLRDGKKKE